MRPQDYREAEKRATELGADLLGFYHSHPDHPARPSQYDLDHAWPFFSYIIVSVRAAPPEDMTSWRLRDDRSAFDPEDLNLCLTQFTFRRRFARSPTRRNPSRSAAPPSASCSPI